MFRSIVLVAALIVSGQAHAAHMLTEEDKQFLREHPEILGHVLESDHQGGYWNGTDYSGRGMQGGQRECRMYNDRCYGPEWCWTNRGVPFRCE
jgi:hypothetical protein